MKKTAKFFLFLIFLSQAMLFSCKKEKNPTSNGSIIKNTYFKLKKDGVFYNANFLNAFDIQDNAIYFEALTSNSAITINSYSGSVRKDISPGTYQFMYGESNDFSLYHFKDENSYYGFDSGQITIISNDTLLKAIHATFELGLYNDELNEYPMITEGEFVIRY